MIKSKWSILLLLHSTHSAIKLRRRVESITISARTTRNRTLHFNLDSNYVHLFTSLTNIWKWPTQMLNRSSSRIIDTLNNQFPITRGLEFLRQARNLPTQTRSSRRIWSNKPPLLFYEASLGIHKASYVTSRDLQIPFSGLIRHFPLPSISHLSIY